MALENLPKIQSRTDLKRFEPSLTSPSAASMRLAEPMARKILAGYPDYGKAPPQYLLEITEFIALLGPADQAALANTLTGIATKTKFLPTKAEMVEFLNDRHKRLNTRATGYKYLKPGEEDKIEMSPAERRKAQVLEELGYDPMKTRGIERPPLDRAIVDAIQEDRWSISMLKTPTAPASEELKALLREQGFVLPCDREEAA